MDEVDLMLWTIWISWMCWIIWIDIMGDLDQML